MTRYLGAAETAKLVRVALRDAFPGVKFSVRSSTYSMGCSVDVKWVDGPATKAVNHILAQYQGRGMTDNTDYTPSQTRMMGGDEVMFADYVMGQRDYSPELLSRIARRLWGKRYFEHAPPACPVYGEHGWDHDFPLGNYTGFFSTLVWQEAARTHVVSKAEMAGYVPPPAPVNPVLREY